MFDLVVQPLACHIDLGGLLHLLDHFLLFFVLLFGFLHILLVPWQRLGRKQEIQSKSKSKK